MIRLALDTSSVACSVALCDGSSIIERHVEKPREHTQLLMPMIRDVLNEAQMRAVDLDAIVLGNGPGSFIGLRIAASVAQGIAHVAGIKIIATSSMAALAIEALQESTVNYVAVAQDAHMGEVYLGLYERDQSKGTKAVIAERLQSVAEVHEMASTSDREWVGAGVGWRTYPGLLAANSAFVTTASDLAYPKAKFLFALASTAPALEPQAIEPVYLRAEVAQKPKSLKS